MKAKLSDLADELVKAAYAFTTSNSFSEFGLALCYIKSVAKKIDNIRAVDFDTREVKIK
jgi:hypothetical protein